MPDALDHLNPARIITLPHPHPVENILSERLIKLMHMPGGVESESIQEQWHATVSFVRSVSLAFFRFCPKMQ